MFALLYNLSFTHRRSTPRLYTTPTQDFLVAQRVYYKTKLL